MVGHDPQRTNRSPEIASVHPKLLFTYGPVESSPLVGPDGGIYSWADTGLLALDELGHPRWAYRAYLLDGGPPTMAPDGTVMANGFVSEETSVGNSAVFAVRPEGTLAWRIQPAAFSKFAAPLVDPNGLLYVPFVGPTEINSGLGEVKRSGKARLLQHGFSFFSVALGRDRSIYAIGRYPSHQSFLTLERLSAAGKRLWSHTLGANGTGLLVDPRGNVYATDGADIGMDSGSRGTIVAYGPRGRRLWTLRTSDGRSTLAQAPNGRLVAAGQLGLTAVSRSGRRLWHVPLGRSERDALPSIAIDAAGTIFVGSGDGKVRTISTDGRLLGTLAAGASSTSAAPDVAIGPDGRLVVTGTDGTLRVYGS